MLGTFGDRDTWVVFEGPHSALAFNALDVKRMTASELWLGQAPLPLGSLLGVGAGVHDARARVLELEVASEESVPILARGAMSLRSVSAASVQPFVAPQSLDDEVAACVRGVLLGNSGTRATYLVDPAHLPELVRRHSSLPPARH